MPIFGRKNKGTRKKYQNKALTNAQAREIERVAGTNPTGGAAVGADTKRAEGPKAKRNETAADYRARKKAEMDAKKRALVEKQKAVTASKKKDTPVAEKPKKESKKPMYGDTRTREQVAAGNKRAIANRTAKGKAKKGEKYKYITAEGETVMVTKK